MADEKKRNILKDILSAVAELAMSPGLVAKGGTEKTKIRTAPLKIII